MEVGRMSDKQIRYKLTDKDIRTHNGCSWNIGEERVASGEGTTLCTDGVIHFYDDPLLAVLLNPVHARFEEPRLFECEVKDIVVHDGLKGGCKSMTLLREIALPILTTNQRITFAILCALEVYKESSFQEWANAWLDNSD